MDTFWRAFFILLIFIPLALLWIFALVDLFRRRNLSAIAKVLWLLAIIVVPVLGIFFYFLFRGEDEADSAGETDDGGVDIAEELRKLHDLKSDGVITEEEFEQQKAKLLGM
jgi:uncharacterized membrane protein